MRRDVGRLDRGVEAEADDRADEHAEQRAVLARRDRPAERPGEREQDRQDADPDRERAERPEAVGERAVPEVRADEPLVGVVRDEHVRGDHEADGEHDRARRARRVVHEAIVARPRALVAAIDERGERRGEDRAPAAAHAPRAR